DYLLQGALAPFVLKRPSPACTSGRQAYGETVMMKRHWICGAFAGAVLIALTAASAGAQVVQVSRGDARNAIGFTLGGFFPYGFESRPREDVLVQDLSSADFPHYL